MSKAVRYPLIAGLVSFVLYPLSFAPLDCVVDGTERDLPGRVAEFYGPVVWLESKGGFGTRDLLQVWAGWWGVRQRHPAVIFGRGTIASFESSTSCTVEDIDEDFEPILPLFGVDAADD